MERLSEMVARGMGTVAFLLVSSTVILAWVLANHVIGFLSTSWTGLLNGKGFDPAPFILLNLLFAAVAFYTGALVIIAQKAQTRTDKANEAAAAKHRDELGQHQSELLTQAGLNRSSQQCLCQLRVRLAGDGLRARRGGGLAELTQLSSWRFAPRGGPERR